MNGTVVGRFQLRRSISQGCPIAPLLFALGTGPLMEIPKEWQKEELIDGLKVKGKEEVAILDHLFAHDSLFILKATEHNVATLLYILKIYCDSIGSSINYNKSQML